jgi:hypothetical protein
MLKILFTRSTRIGSKLIRWGLKEPTSHVAIESSGLVFHANPSGVIIEPLEHFKKHSETLFEVELEDGLDSLKKQINTHWRAPYDWGSVLWLTLRSLLKKVGIKISKANLMNSTNMFICHEWVTQVLDGTEDTETTPYQLYLRIKK